MCMKKNNNRLLRGVAAVLCLALMFLTMSGMAMATDMEDAPAGDAPESTPEIVEAELPVTPEETPELSLYGGGRVSFRSIFIKVLKNPLILSTAAGLLCLWLRVPLPRFVQTAVRQMAAVSTPMMLFLLGAFFRFDALSFFQTFLIHGPALDGMVFLDLPRPFAKLHRTGIIDLKSNSDDHLKRVMLQFSRWCRCADTGSHAPGRTARKMRRRRGQGPVFRPADRRPACAGP